MMGKLKNNKNVVMNIVGNNGNALKYASKDMKNDKDVVLAAYKAQYNAIVFHYIGEELKKDLNGIDPVVFFEKYDAKIKLAVSLIKNHADNKDYVLDALKDNGLLLEHVSDRLKNNPQVCMVAITQNKDAQKFIGETLKDCVGVNVKSTLSKLSKVKYVEPVEDKIEVKQEVKRKFKI